MSHNNTIRYWRQRQKRVLIHFIVLSLQQRIHIIAYTYVCNFKFMEFRWNLRESCCEFLEISFPFLWWRWNMDFSWGKIFIWSGQCIYGVMMHFLVLENDLIRKWIFFIRKNLSLMNHFRFVLYSNLPLTTLHIHFIILIIKANT